ncbi:MAG: superoxide dismutase [Prevotellaceae bacterium]|nr:superoxide dismutase [Prevotellaceae bacterium]
MKFELTPLPYALDALAPKMGKQTLELHHGKHLQTYVNNLNNLIPGTPYENMSLEDIIKQSEGPVFNNAAQVWNHNVFFQQFSAKPQAAPTGALLEAISKSFGSFDAFKDQYTKACTALFGSGWVWLVKNADGTLGLESYSNAGNPLKKNLTALLGCDVWEHAYYLDYQNRRADYIAAFWQLVDWKVVEGRLK